MFPQFKLLRLMQQLQFQQLKIEFLIAYNFALKFNINFELIN